MPGHPLEPLLDLPGVSEVLDEATAAVDRLLGHRVLRQASARVSAESALRGARASAALAGPEHDHELALVRSGDADDPVLAGALRATGEVGALVDVWGRAPRQALARLHTLAARDLLDDEALGRPRVDDAVSLRLDALAGLVTTGRVGGPGRRPVPAVVLAGVVHAEVLALDAFPPVSGLVARAAERLTLVWAGLDPKSLVIPEVGHVELGAQEYADTLAAFGTGTPEGVAAWLRHCAHAVALGAREATAVCQAIERG